MVQPEYVAGSTLQSATFSVQCAEAKILRPLAIVRSQMDWGADRACQLYRSVSCPDSSRPGARRERNLLVDFSRSNGQNSGRRSGARGVRWQSQLEAGSCLRMELWCYL